MIYIGADHRGFELKKKIESWLTENEYEYADVGAFEYDKGDDYPDFGKAVAEGVVAEEGSKGIVICGSGIGIAIAANKIAGIRAGNILKPEQAEAAVNDEDLNVLSLSADYSDYDSAIEIIQKFLETHFSGAERHVRRLNKLKELEK